eukprot:evm.model.NODE_887_length_8772_cov_55.767899.3
MGSEEMQAFDLDTKHGLQALQVFLRFVLAEQEIDERYVPARIREHPQREAEKARFQKFLQENLSLVDLAKPLAQETHMNAGQSGRRRSNAKAKGTGSITISRLFNRMLALSVDAQHEVFDFFELIHQQILEEAKSQGTYDTGVTDVYAEQILQVKKTELVKLQGVPLTLYALKLDRGIPFDKAINIRDDWYAKLRKLRAEEDRVEELAAGRGAKEGNFVPVITILSKKNGKYAVKGGVGGGGELLGSMGAAGDEEYVNDEVEPDGSLYDGSGTGFYVHLTHPDQVVLALEIVSSAFSRRKLKAGSLGARMEKRYKIISPNTGRRGIGPYYYKEFQIAGSELQRQWVKVKPARKNLEMVERKWTRFNELTLKQCIHHARGQRREWRTTADGRQYEVVGDVMCWCNPNNANYSRSRGGSFCPVGRRKSTSYILSGAVVPIWPAIQGVVIDQRNKYIQVVRCVTQEERLVGLDIKQGQKKELMAKLEEFMEALGLPWKEEVNQLALTAKKGEENDDGGNGGDERCGSMNGGGCGGGRGGEGGGDGAGGMTVPASNSRSVNLQDPCILRNLDLVKMKMRGSASSSRAGAGGGGSGAGSNKEGGVESEQEKSWHLLTSEAANARSKEIYLELMRGEKQLAEASARTAAAAARAVDGAGDTGTGEAFGTVVRTIGSALSSAGVVLSSAAKNLVERRSPTRPPPPGPSPTSASAAASRPSATTASAARGGAGDANTRSDSGGGGPLPSSLCQPSSYAKLASNLAAAAWSTPSSTAAMTRSVVAPVSAAAASARPGASTASSNSSDGECGGGVGRGGAEGGGGGRAGGGGGGGATSMASPILAAASAQSASSRKPRGIMDYFAKKGCGGGMAALALKRAPPPASGRVLPPANRDEECEIIDLT